MRWSCVPTEASDWVQNYASKVKRGGCCRASHECRIRAVRPDTEETSERGKTKQDAMVPNKRCRQPCSVFRDIGMVNQFH